MLHARTSRSRAAIAAQFLGLTLAVTFAGCTASANSQGSLPAIPAQTSAGSLAQPQSRLEPRSMRPDWAFWVDTCEAGSNDCLAIKPNTFQPPVFEGPFNGASGVAVGPTGLQYIADTYAKVVHVYTFNGTAVEQCAGAPILDADGYPIDVAVSTTFAKLAVANYYAPGNLASVTVYPLGANGCPNGPSWNLRDSDPSMASAGIAFDHSGNCYWSRLSDHNPAVAHIDEFAGCSPSSTAAALNVSLSAPAGLAFDNKTVAGQPQNNLWYVDPAVGIYKCSFPYNLCVPVLEVALVGIQYLNFGTLQGAVNNHWLYFSDPAGLRVRRCHVIVGFNCLPPVVHKVMPQAPTGVSPFPAQVY